MVLRSTLVFAAAFIAILPFSAQAQERQTYNPYAAPSGAYGASPNGYQTQSQGMGQYRVYPGRETYGDNFGYIPRHPGDYRDAVDRGQWEGGGAYRPARQSTYGY